MRHIARATLWTLPVCVLPFLLLVAARPGHQPLAAVRRLACIGERWSMPRAPPRSRDG